MFQRHHELNIKDGFFIAVFGWIVISAVSALPFMIYGAIPSFTDAFFEMMSGHTTSGATILTDIEIVPHGLLFWRSQTHLLGGMGFLTPTVNFLPDGIGGVRIFRGESSPGQVITKEKFIPRNRDTMIWLWGIYLTSNVLETLLLLTKNCLSQSRKCANGFSIFLCVRASLREKSEFGLNKVIPGAYSKSHKPFSS